MFPEPCREGPASSDVRRSGKALFLTRVSNWQVQRTTTFQPCFSSAHWLRRSRWRFFSIFSLHHAVLVFGKRKCLQPSCPCQKQPFTKTTARYFGRTMSGFPGNCLFFGPLTVNRNPQRWRMERTKSSGRVSLPRIRDITQLRFSLPKVSTTTRTLCRQGQLRQEFFPAGNRWMPGQIKLG